jgi:hypothetical protein
MKRHIQAAAILVLALSLGLASGAAAQAPKSAAAEATTVKAMEAAMNPGEGQKRLNFMIGEFDVKIRTWIDPSKAPFESRAVAVCKWVLGDRYIQQMLSGFVMGEPWSGIGYAGYDNVTKKYQATYMDSASTGMEWFSGAMAADGKSAKLTATINDAITNQPRKVEMRLHVAANGDHITEMWQADKTGKMAMVMELRYTRKSS